ncbi:cyclin-T1-4 isoform X2 [Brachypodium distachyon]|uniref:Cyclin-like domain-containing protein n=1 Tax=Brachypodium distachyon TaxID=15368 RepID=A0A0Q3G5K7_BRADI|nr:cyclin-T1-4 isoform X2 [Brachypodium distachyon]KQK05717.1 hypothetical protein BRADI_2g22097v3 [Brachypodium distachyon]|eukprot:XP_014755120.1 cyclin-T1-4 isoform X2 [Brachypodium distachyon]
MDMPPSDLSHHGIVENSPYRITKGGNEEAAKVGASWYFSRKEIEENSPSKRDGIDLKKESYLRKSYCKYLQELGMRLKVPQATIATSIVFCHRFYLRQSHAKNDRREVYDRQKELILLGERVVLATLGFDLNVHHPYKPLVAATKKYKISDKGFFQIAWNFVNDGLFTSLCLQFKPHHIAAGALFLAGKFLKVKFLPDDSEKTWYREFDVTPRQLEEISNQLLELYEQKRAVQSQPSHGNEAEKSSACVPNQRACIKAQDNSEEPHVLGNHQASKQSDTNHSTSTIVPIHNGAEHSNRDKQIVSQKILQIEKGDHGSDKTSSLSGVKVNTGIDDGLHHDTKSLPGSSISIDKSDIPTEEQKSLASHGSFSETRDGNLINSGGPSVSSSMMDAMNKIDKEKVKAALEKQRKLKGDVAMHADVMDDDDLLESELEHGVELAVEDEKIEKEKSHGHLHQKDDQNTDAAAENRDHIEKNVPDTAKEAEVTVDVTEQRSPTKRSDSLEPKSQQPHDAPQHSEGHDDAQLVVTDEEHKMPRPEG